MPIIVVRGHQIHIMDEATASVDPATERDLVAGIDRLQHDRTSLTVAHRLATIANADEVIVFSRGRIAERGTQQELANRGGSYARLEAVYRGGLMPGLAD